MFIYAQFTLASKSQFGTKTNSNLDEPGGENDNANGMGIVSLQNKSNKNINKKAGKSENLQWQLNNKKVQKCSKISRVKMDKQDKLVFYVEYKEREI